MGKVKATLWASKTGPDGMAPVYITLRHKNRRAVLATPIRIRPRDWNDRASEARKTHRDFKSINDYLSDRVDEADSALLRAILAGETDPCQAAKRELEQGSGEADFLSFCRERLAMYRDRAQHGTHEAYSVVIDKMEAYCRDTRRRRLPISSIDVRFLEGFHTWLVRERGNGPATARKALSTVRTFLYAAIREGMLSQADNPFFQFKMPSAPPGAAKRPLSIEEIWKLEDAEFSGALERNARDVFVFAFYEGGVRISDVLQLTGENLLRDGDAWRVSYAAEKTGKVSYAFPLWPSAERILRAHGWPEKAGYLFPYLTREEPGTAEMFAAIKRKTSLVNKGLRSVQEKLGISVKLSTHVARHTFSHYLDEEGWSIQQIQHLLRHHDSQQTEVYLRSMRTSRYDERLRGAFRRESGYDENRQA